MENPPFASIDYQWDAQSRREIAFRRGIIPPTPIHAASNARFASKSTPLSHFFVATIPMKSDFNTNAAPRNKRRANAHRNKLLKVYVVMFSLISLDSAIDFVYSSFDRASVFGRSAAVRLGAGSIRLATIASGAEYVEFRRKDDAQSAKRAEAVRAMSTAGNPIKTPGYCFPCRSLRVFSTPFDASAAAGATPNWREGLLCPVCHMNSRTRASAHLLASRLKADRSARIFLTEQTTPLYRWVSKHYPHVIGSEYLRDGTPRGSTDDRGIRHEDLTQLSLADASVDFIVSLEVFEHIPDYRAALAECARTLRPAGAMLFTVPFTRRANHSIRAVMNDDGTIDHILPPEYHGDPLDPAGCLCFRHFGWEILDDLRSAGFRQAEAVVVWSKRFGYTEDSPEMIQFVALK